MAVVLTPILKNSLSDQLKDSNINSAHVKFDLPDEKESVIQYLKESSAEPYSTKLNSVVKIILSSGTDQPILLKWIAEFKDNILFLGKNECIISALLNLNWYTKSESFVSVYEEFILNLVTAHTTYLKSVLLMIIKIFVSVSDSNEDITEEERRNFQNAHRLAKHIVKLLPLSKYQLCTLLSEKFPYMKNSTHVLHCYVENLLSTCSYVPSWRPAILECIVAKLIHIDVHCSREIIEMFEVEEEEKNQLIMNHDMDVDDATCAKKQDVMAYPLADSLDVLMNCMFKYIQKICFPNEGRNINWEATKKLYKELLTIFDKIILPTRGSCHVQYLMFYICSLKQELCDGFLDYLWKKVQNPNIGPVFRQLSSFYIGSLLSRAKYISISTVTACFDLMCNWIHRYIDNHTIQDLSVHGTFHSVCQTVFYVFAFRSKELIEMEKGDKYLRSLNFDRIVTCRLNPLRFCDRTIVHNFANIARNFQIAYVYPVIEKNNRNLLYTNWESNTEILAGAMIQTFFPFDPYLLKRSKHWIESHYRIYNHCHKDDEAMDQVEDEEMCLSDALFTYGTSPGFKKSYLLKT